MNVWLELNGWWKLYTMPPQIFNRGWMLMEWMPPMNFSNRNADIPDTKTVEFRRDFSTNNTIKPPCNPEYPVFRGRVIP